MAIQQSINAIKSAAINKIKRAMENPSVYHLQWDETLDEARVLAIRNIVRTMDKEIEAAKKKYKKKQIDRENAKAGNK